MTKARLLLLFALATTLAVAGCQTKSPVKMRLNDDVVRFSGATYHGGEWRLDVRGVKPALRPGETFEWLLDYEMSGEDYRRVIPSLDSVGVALAARRMFDADGRFKDQSGTFYSTQLTPSGLPVEGQQWFIASSYFGGPYRTPLDIYREIPKSKLSAGADRIRFRLPLRVTIPADFPAGVYRLELAVVANVRGEQIRLPLLLAVDQSLFGCNLPYQDAVFAPLLFPPVRIGEPRPPRMVWTLFSSYPNQGVAGVVAKEDEKHFAVTTRVKLPTRYTLPCVPERDACEFPVEPDMPTLNRMHYFQIRDFVTQPFEPDWSRGSYTATITNPDGKVVKLGPFDLPQPDRLTRQLWRSPAAYRFSQYGRYEIRLTGEMYDRFGNRYLGGGTYEVWVALPLTFATGVKPGTPMQVGGFYSPAATINPPVPADVTASIKFYPALQPAAVQTSEYRGRAQRFGYFFPPATQPPLRFPEAGEYLFEIFATYRDRDGRLFMGNMRNASVVLPPEPNLKVMGLPPNYYSRSFDLAIGLDGNSSMGQSAVLLPRNSGDTTYLAGNSTSFQIIMTSLEVEEPTGYLGDFLRRRFPPALLRLGRSPAPANAFASRPNLFPGCQEQIRHFASSNDGVHNLALLSATAEGYSPREYPEQVAQRGYFYMASSRPGFPVFFTIADSTVADNYWKNGFGDYMGTIGAARQGDQPGDVSWTIASGFFADPVGGRTFAGAYSSGGATLPRGGVDRYRTEPFGAPVARINGRDVELYAGVGPSPGTLYETGAVKGIGSIAVPMVAHNVQIDVHQPDGTVRECRGRADALGNYVCPGGPLVLAQPGVYRVFTRFEENGHVGTCAGAPGGWYKFYVVAENSPFRVVFGPQLPRRVAYDGVFEVTGQVEPPLASGTVHYSFVTPGMLLDEGEQPLDRGRFHFRFYPHEMGAQFSNLTDFRGRFNKRGFAFALLDIWSTLFKGYRERMLSDTIEVVVFVDGRQADGTPVTAGGKFVLRGEQVVVPAEFAAAPRPAR